MNAYKRLSNKGKDITRNTTYASIITNSLLQMFEYKTDMSVDCTTLFETLLLTHGKASIVEWNGKHVPVMIDGGGAYLPDGSHEYYTASYISGTDSFNLDNDYPICWNTSDRLPALNILRFADMLSEVDLSMVFNLQRSRLAPVPIAKNDAVRKQIDNIMTSIQNGDFKAISADIEKDILTGKTQAVEMLNFNDPKAIEYMNYLSELHDALTRRIYTMYGMAIQETSKHAQVNKDESNARDGVSWLIPENMLRVRKDFINRFNKKFGTNWSVDFSDLFKKERDIYDSNGNTDNRTDTINSNNSNSEQRTEDTVNQ